MQPMQVVFMVAAVITAYSVFCDGKDDAEQDKQAERADRLGRASRAGQRAYDAACRKDLKCMGERHFVDAETSCPFQIQQLALHDYEWTDGALSPKMESYSWVDVDRGILRYTGSALKMQNGFGAWNRVVYSCDLDTRTLRVVAVDAR